MLSMRELSRVYRADTVETTALDAIDLDIAEGEFVAIMGPSGCGKSTAPRSEEHTSELQSLMRISYAVFCLKKKTHKQNITNTTHTRVTQIFTHFYITDSSASH